MNRRSPLILITLAGLGIGACAPAPATSAPSSPATAPATPAEATNSTPAPELEHLRVAMLPYMSFTPLYMAQAEGYYAEQGLEVEFVDFGTNATAGIPLLLQGELDVGTSAANAQVLNVVAAGERLRFVADKGYVDPDAACTADAWVARNELLNSGQLSNLPSLRGKKVVSATGQSFEYIFDEMLARGGLSVSDVELVEIRDNPTRIEALKNGTIDVAYMGEPWVMRSARDGNAGVWMGYQDLVPGFPIAMIVFGPNLLDEKPDVGVRFMAAYLKAVRQFVEQGKSERNLQLLSEFTQLPAEELRAMCWNSFKTDGTLDKKWIQKIIDWSLAKGYISESLSADEVYEPQFVQAAAALLGN